MRGYSQNIFITAIMILLGAACNKPVKTPAKDITKPILDITTPAPNQLYKSQEPLNIIGTISDNELGKLELKIYSVKDSVKLYDKTIGLKGTGYLINQQFVRYVPDSIIQYMLSAAAYDVTGNKSVDTTYFTMYD